MARLSGKRPEVGALFEIRTDAGYGYLKKVHLDPQYGEVLRVFPMLSLEQLSLEEVPTLKQGREKYFIGDLVAERGGESAERLADMLGQDTRMVFKHYRHPVTSTVSTAVDYWDRTG